MPGRGGDITAAGRGDATEVARRRRGGGAAASWRHHGGDRLTTRHGGVTAGHDGGATLRRRRYGGSAVASRQHGGSGGGRQPGPLCRSATCCCYCPPTPPPSRADERVSSLPSHLSTAEGTLLTRRQYRRRGPKPVGSSCAKMLSRARGTCYACGVRMGVRRTVRACRAAHNMGARWQPT